ncbi:hypothetical protein pb186bvf_012843 [Paramecium bursaria]
MIHSEGSHDDEFNPPDQQGSSKQKLESKRYAVIDQNVRVSLLRRILSKEATIKEAAREFGLNFSTAKAILQTYRKEGRIGKKKNRERNKIKAEGTQRQIQSMYDLERDPPIVQNQQLQNLMEQIPQMRVPMSSPNLDEKNAQMALIYYQRELNRQKLINLQLFMLLNQRKEEVQEAQIQITKAEEPI